MQILEFDFGKYFRVISTTRKVYTTRRFFAMCEVKILISDSETFLYLILAEFLQSLYSGHQRHGAKYLHQVPRGNYEVKYR